MHIKRVHATSAAAVFAALAIFPATGRAQCVDGTVPLRATSVTGQARGGGQAPPAARAAERRAVAAEGRAVEALRCATTLLPARLDVWVGVAFSCDDCTLAQVDGQPRWSFATPPEVYSVEQGSPAYDAGLRRGDVITHVQNIAITTAEGGRRWAALRPGDAVRVTYRRDGASRSVMLRPVESPARAATTMQLSALLRESVASSDTAATALMRQYRETVAQQSEERAALVRRLTTQTSQARGSDDEARLMRQLVTEYAERDAALLSRQQEQVEALLRLRQADAERALTAVAEGSNRIALTSPGAATSVGSGGRALTTVPLAGQQQLRFSGTFGGSDIEVRGGQSVVVTEQAGELLIITPGATIRIRRPDRN